MKYEGKREKRQCLRLARSHSKATDDLSRYFEGCGRSPEAFRGQPKVISRFPSTSRITRTLQLINFTWTSVRTYRRLPKITRSAIDFPTSLECFWYTKKRRRQRFIGRLEVEFFRVRLFRWKQRLCNFFSIQYMTIFDGIKWCFSSTWEANWLQGKSFWCLQPSKTPPIPRLTNRTKSPRLPMTLLWATQFTIEFTNLPSRKLTSVYSLSES